METPILHVALHEPMIAPNTGNIARTCAATGVVLHLIGRLGFRLDDRSLKRAGCDYWPHVDVRRHSEWASFRRALPDARILAFSAHSRQNYTQFRYQAGDCLLFGNEENGLPPSLLEAADAVLTLPMKTGVVRSLNLATAAGIGLYEALRQVEGW